MSDRLKQILEQQEAIQRLINPFGDLHSQLISAVSDHSKAYDLGIANDLANEQLRLLSHLGDFGETVHLGIDGSPHLRGAGGALEEAMRIGLQGHTSSLADWMAATVVAQQAYAHQFRLPEVMELRQIVGAVFQEKTLARTIFDTTEPLISAMASMTQPWLQTNHADVSAKALCDILVIGKGIDGLRAYDISLIESLRRSLGDWRDIYTPPVEILVNPVTRTRLYVDKGFDVELTEFTPKAFDEGLEAAGLNDPSSVDSADENGAALSRSGVAFDRLLRFEIALRRYIERVMHARCGPNWMKQRIPGPMLEGWIDKRDKAVKAGQPECPLIDYADFSEYRIIIERKDNWQEFFKVTFGRIEDVRESFQRLYPVRIATMHARIITLDDEMMLWVETKRLLKAINRC